MATRNATAQWNGGLKDGNGTMAGGSGAFDAPFTYRSRFEEGAETNPEELIGAALAGCYSMQLSAMLEADGHAPESVRTEAKVTLRAGDAGPHIARIDLVSRGRVDLDAAAFEQTAAAAKDACLVHNALAGVGEITLDAALDA
jgi:osmotically inducible protein OsmC